VTIAVVYRLVILHELMCLVDMSDKILDNPEAVMEIIRLCGSFLIIRDDIVYFMHQPTKDLLLNETSDEVFPFGLKKNILHNSIEIPATSPRKCLPACVFLW
jgi:hypothetical protein